MRQRGWLSSVPSHKKVFVCLTGITVPFFLIDLPASRDMLPLKLVVSRSFLFGPIAAQEGALRQCTPIGSEGFLSQSFLDTPAKTCATPSR
jgi:hypothetical protein